MTSKSNNLLSLFLLLLTIFACDKKEEQGSSSATIVEQNDDSVVVRLLANISQSYTASLESIQGASIVLPEGALAEEVEVKLRLGTSLVNDFLTLTYGTEDSLKVSSFGPAIEFRPLSDVNLQSEISVTIPKGSDLNGNSTNLAVLYKGVDEIGLWRSGIFGSNYIADNGSTVNIKTPVFGRFQVVSLESKLTNNVEFVSQGAGPWYGIEFDLYSQFIEPEVDGPDHALFGFNDRGAMNYAESNGIQYSPPPSFDFESLVSDYPNVYDASGIGQVSLGLFTKDFDYGFWFDFRTTESQMTTRLLQRNVQKQLPTDSLDINQISGDYLGLSSTLKSSGNGMKVDVVYQTEKLILIGSGDKVSVTGTIKGEAIDLGEFNITGNETAKKLGFFTGNLTIKGVSHQAFLIPSIDRKALGVVVCSSDITDNCPVGDGTGTYQAQNMFFGVFEKN